MRATLLLSVLAIMWCYGAFSIADSIELEGEYGRWYNQTLLHETLNKTGNYWSCWLNFISTQLFQMSCLETLRVFEVYKLLTQCLSNVKYESLWHYKCWEDKNRGTALGRNIIPDYRWLMKMNSLLRIKKKFPAILL